MSYASTSGPRPASARRSGCSKTAAAGGRAGPTWSPARFETHGRPYTADLLAGFETVPLATVLDRHPDAVLVDELAAPGRRRLVESYRDAGITVLTTLNVQHLESLADAVERITGHRPRETVADAVIRGADHLELVDLTADELRKRLAEGHLYGPDQADVALERFFTDEHLTALRELARQWLAGGRERVAVALTGGPEGETLIRRAARIAARSPGAQLMAVHVVRSDGLVDASPANLARQRVLVESLGGSYHQVLGTDIAAALLAFAHEVNATQLVLGASRRSRFAQLFAPGVGAAAAAGSGSVDVHLVTHEEVSRGRARFGPGDGSLGGLTRRRRILGLAAAVVGLPVLTFALSGVRGELTFPSDVLLFLAAVVGIALLGGLYPALGAAVGGFLLLNYYFTPPLHEFTVDRPENVLGLVVFLVVATAVSAAVELAARRTAEASSARAEAATLSTVAGSVLRGEHPLTALLQQLRETFALTGVTLLERSPDNPTAWRLAATVGRHTAISPADGDAAVPIGEELMLVLTGRLLGAADRRVLGAFAAQAEVALRQQRLAAQAAAADRIGAADRLRSALLSAVSHDLRTPLASAKAAVTSLRSPDVAFGPEDRDELLATADESLDRLIGLVENLLDMSRLQAGVLGVHAQLFSVADVLPRVVDDVGTAAVTVRVPDELAEVRADPALVERILVNVLTNAVRYSPPGRPPAIAVTERGDEVEVRVIDHGPGIPDEARELVFQPFQRLGDRDSGTGVGLGLALSRGLAEAMGGTLQPATTPGGGLTMVLRLPVALPVAGP